MDQTNLMYTCRCIFYIDFIYFAHIDVAVWRLLLFIIPSKTNPKLVLSALPWISFWDFSSLLFPLPALHWTAMEIITFSPCYTAADLHPVKCDIATRAEGLCKVSIKLRGKSRVSSLYAHAINHPINYWPLKGWLLLFMNTHPAQSNVYIILPMTGTEAKLIKEHSPHVWRELVWGEVRKTDQSI